MRLNICFTLLLAFLCVLICSQPVAYAHVENADALQQQNNEQATYDYRAQAGVYGTITSVGSDTLAGLMALWAQEFQRAYPHIKFQIQASGSATAGMALTQGSANIGTMSREMSSQEIRNFVYEHGYPPTAIVVAIDAIGVYVERGNPITKLSLTQLDSLFSITRLCGGERSISDWRQLGVDVFGTNNAVQLYGRNSASGTYDLFKQNALCGGDFKRDVNEMPSSSSIVQSVASSAGGLGYAALGYSSDKVKTLALSMNGKDYYAPSQQNLRSGNYPFARNLYIIVNKPPGKRLSVLEDTFLRFVLSEQGQDIVDNNGYYSISKRLISRQLQALEPDSIQPKIENNQ